MGTLINAISIVIASGLGLLLKKRLSEKLQTAIMATLGLVLLVLSLGWFVKDYLAAHTDLFIGETELLVLVSILAGTIIGTLIDIDARFSRLMQNIETKRHWPPVTQGFVTATLIFGVGAMAIVGSIQDGANGDMTMLLMKSALDFVTALVLASTLGIGVMFSALSVLIYQGAITLLARFLAPVMTADFLRALSLVGQVIIVAISLNFLDIKKIKVANMLPSLIFPILYFALRTLF